MGARRSHLGEDNNLTVFLDDYVISQNDVRTLHRGTPNPSPDPRPELCLCYGRNFWHIDQTIKMPESSYRALSARGKQLLKRCRPVVWV